MDKKPLKVGILLDSYTVPAWALTMLENMANSEQVEIALVVLNKKEKTKVNKTIISKVKNNRGRLGYLLIRKLLEVAYDKLVDRGAHLPDANKGMDCLDLLVDLPTIQVVPTGSKGVDYFSEPDIDVIKSHDLDILVRCGFGILKGGVLNASKYGIWSFHHGDNLTNRGGPAGFWESMESWPETGVMLQILTEDLDNGKVLTRSYSSTNRMSARDNNSNNAWKALSFMTRKMEELYLLGEEEFFRRVNQENNHPVFYSDRLYTKPTNFELAVLTFRKLVEKTKHLYENSFFFEQWILLFNIKEEFSSSLWRYKKIIPPKDRFWADPDIIYKNNKYYIFIEEYLYETKKGHISLITMEEDGSYSQPEVVLDKPYHLSYPHLFEYEGEHYMIPESMANNTIELYKCTDFPSKWEFQMNLMENISAVDATVFQYKDRWWMFVNMVENSNASTWDELFLFSSDELLSNNWKPHPLNPIVSDCKTARPAGSIFFENGSFYRPSQNCSNAYGFGFNISEIVKLDKDNFEEKIVSSVKPNWDKRITGTHTFNRVNALHVIDAKYRRRK
jgi:hypothetical protein